MLISILFGWKGIPDFMVEVFKMLQLFLVESRRILDVGFKDYSRLRETKSTKYYLRTGG